LVSFTLFFSAATAFNTEVTALVVVVTVVTGAVSSESSAQRSITSDTDCMFREESVWNILRANV